MSEIVDYLNPLPRYGARLVLFGVMMLAASIGVALLARGEYNRAAVWDAQEKALRLQSRPKPAAKLSKVQTEDLKRWALLKEERTFSWEPVFVAVEKASNPDIELLAFQPEKSEHRLTLRGEGKDGLAVVEFIQRLGTQKILREVRLTRQKSMKRGLLTTVSFEIKADLAG